MINPATWKCHGPVPAKNNPVAFQIGSSCVCAGKIHIRPITRPAGLASLRTFSEFDDWHDLQDDARAYEIYRYLADKETGLFHMNVVAEGNDALSEFVQIRDPIKIINVYGYGYCGILGPTMAGVCEGVGLGPSRTLVLPAWNHVAAETFYNGDWHYLDLDVRAAFRRDDGTLASLQEARQDRSLWRGRGPLFFPNDPLESTRAIYEKTSVQTYHGFHQTGHTMDFVLRPGESFTRWWTPQGGRWHHVSRYNELSWLRELIESPPRGPKPNHRHFTVHNHGNGKFVYEPQLNARYADFSSGVHHCSNVAPTEAGLASQNGETGWAVFEVRSPYIMVPRVGRLDRVDDDRGASVVEINGRHVSLSISTDNGLTWHGVSDEMDASDGRAAGKNRARFDLTRWVSGRYGYLLKLALDGHRDAVVRRLKMTTWVQVAPASLPALQKGNNSMTLVTGDHYGLDTQIMEVRSRAGRPGQLLKYLVAPPKDYDPERKTARIRGSVTVQVKAPPRTKIAWFTATGQFKTYQRKRAAETRNHMAYTTDRNEEFKTVYEADVPSYTNHWHYNAAREVMLEEPSDQLFVRYTGNPALNNFAIYAHCLPDHSPVRPPLEVTHQWTENGQQKQARATLQEDRSYKIETHGEPVNQSVRLFVKSQPSVQK